MMKKKIWTDLDNLRSIFQIGTLLRGRQNFDDSAVGVDDDRSVHDTILQQHGRAPEGFQLRRHREVFPNKTVRWPSRR